MERKIKYFWVDTFKYNVEEDKHLSNLKDKSFILGSEIKPNELTKDENKITLKLEENKDLLIKLNKNQVIQSFSKKKLCNSLLTNIPNLNIYDAVCNLMNLHRQKQNFCFIEDNTVIVFPSNSIYYPTNNDSSFSLDFYENVNIMQSSLYLSPGINIKIYKPIIDTCRSLLEEKTFEDPIPSELVYLKSIQYLLDLNDNHKSFHCMNELKINYNQQAESLSDKASLNLNNSMRKSFSQSLVQNNSNKLKRNLNITFLSNNQKSNNNKNISNENMNNLTCYEDYKYFLQNLSIYNKFRNSNALNINNANNLNFANQNEEQIFGLLDYLTNGLKLLEIFGCASKANSTKTANMLLPRFKSYINLTLDAKTKLFAKAKINIIEFNKGIFSVNKNSDECINQRLFDIIYLILKFIEPSESDKFQFFEDVSEYKLLQKFNENLIDEDNYDDNNYNILDSLLNIFSFNINEINNIFSCISLILFIYNVEFSDLYLKENEPCKIIDEEKVIEGIRKILGLSSKISDNEIKKPLIYRISVGEFNVFNSNLTADCTAKDVDIHFDSEMLNEIFDDDNNVEKNPMSIQECNANKINLIANIYENIFYFIVEKINIKLEEKSNSNLLEEPIEMIVSYFSNNKYYFKADHHSNLNGGIYTINNLYDLNSFYQSEKTIQNYENNKIEVHLKNNVKADGLLFISDLINKEIVHFFENDLFGFNKILKTLKTKKNESYNNKVYNLDVLEDYYKKMKFLIKENIKAGAKNIYDPLNLNEFPSVYYPNIDFDEALDLIKINNIEGGCFINLRSIFEEIIHNNTYNYLFLAYLADKNEKLIAKYSKIDSFYIDFFLNKVNNFNDNITVKYKNYLSKIDLMKSKEGEGINNNLKHFYIFDISNDIIGFESKENEVISRSRIFNSLQKFRISSLIENKKLIFNYKYSLKEFVDKHKILLKEDKQKDINKDIKIIADKILEESSLNKENFYLNDNYVYLNLIGLTELEEKLNIFINHNEDIKLNKLVSKMKGLIKMKIIKEKVQKELKIRKENTQSEIIINKNHNDESNFIKENFFNLADNKKTTVIDKKVNKQGDYEITEEIHLIPVIKEEIITQEVYKKPNESRINPFIREEITFGIRETKNAKTSSDQSIFEAIFEKDVKKYTGNFLNSILKQLDKSQNQIKTSPDNKNKRFSKDANFDKDKNKMIKENIDNVTSNNNDKKNSINSDINKINNIINRQRMRNSKLKAESENIQNELSNKKQIKKNEKLSSADIQSEGSKENEKNIKQNLNKINNKPINFNNLNVQEMEKNLHHILLVQKFFRKLFLKKYNLFGINQYLMYQNERIIRNYEHNFNYLFNINNICNETSTMANDYLNTRNNNERVLATSNNFNYNYKNTNVLTQNSYLRSNKKKIDSNTSLNNPFEEGKIHLYAKVLDVDFMVKLKLI